MRKAAKKIITVSVRTDIERKFREMAKLEFGAKKGYLGDAITEAMREWIERRARKAEKGILRALEEGIALGGITYRKREELHER